MQQYNADPQLVEWIINNMGDIPAVYSDLSKIKHLDSLKVNRAVRVAKAWPPYLAEKQGDFSLLGHMANLQSLRLYWVNDMIDFSFLPKCKSLEKLDVRNTDFSDCSLLSELSSLKYLYLPRRKTLKNMEVLNTFSAKIEIQEPFYHDEDFANMVIVNGQDVTLHYRGFSQVNYVHVGFIDKCPHSWLHFSQEENNWSKLEAERARQMMEQLLEAIINGKVRDLVLSLEPWGEGHFLSVDFAHGWSAAVYMDDDRQEYYSPYNPEYNSVEELAPVDIGGQTPVPKMFALEDMRLMADIVRCFLETGQLCPHTQWEKSGGGNLF